MKQRPRVLHLDALPQGVLLFTKPQMAAAMQVSLRCLSGMMQRGEISYLKINGKMVRFRPEDALRRLNETALVVEGSVRSAKERLSQTKESSVVKPQPLPGQESHP